jgi:sec-independent protein translocase protein TatA
MLLFFDVSGGEIVVILMFVLIFFGSKKIPEMARGLGKGIREIKDASDSIKREIQKEGNKMKDELVNTGQSMLDAAKDEDSTESNQSAEVQEEPKSISSSEEEAPEEKEEVKPFKGPIPRDQEFS